MAKITAATIKSFIRKNQGSLYIKVRSSFDGMTDGLAYYDNGFTEAKEDTELVRNTWGVRGAWFVNGSRDYFEAYQEGNYKGYHIFNACGSFYIAVKIAETNIIALIQFNKTNSLLEANYRGRHLEVRQAGSQKRFYEVDAINNKEYCLSKDVVKYLMHKGSLPRSNQLKQLLK